MCMTFSKDHNIREQGVNNNTKFLLFRRSIEWSREKIRNDGENAWYKIIENVLYADDIYLLVECLNELKRLFIN